MCSDVPYITVVLFYVSRTFLHLCRLYCCNRLYLLPTLQMILPLHCVQTHVISAFCTSQHQHRLCLCILCFCYHLCGPYIKCRWHPCFILRFPSLIVPIRLPVSSYHVSLSLLFKKAYSCSKHRGTSFSMLSQRGRGLPVTGVLPSFYYQSFERR